jgi:hypothetical protein
LSLNHRKYQHEKLEIVLDDCFSNGDVAAGLTAGGYVLEEFTKYFPRDDEHLASRQQSVKDVKVIALSHKEKKVVFTTDHRMRDAHRAEFLKHRQAMVVSTAHRQGGDDLWVQAFVKAKCKIERLHKKQSRPWFAKITQDGGISCCESFDCADEPEE